MDLVKLRYFYTTAKLGNISLAAKELSLTQPALSKAIASLEAELNMNLFSRIGKRIQLNENGLFLMKQAEDIFKEVENAERALKDLNTQHNRELSIVTTLPYLLPELLSLFIQEHPQVSYKQFPLSKENLTNFVERAAFDICIATENIEYPNTEWVPLFDEQIFLCVPNNEQFATKVQIDLFSLEDYPLIGLSPRYHFRQLMDSYCTSIQYQANYQIEVEEATAVIDLVKKGIGAAFIPETSIDYNTNAVKYLTITNVQFIRTIGLLKHHHTYQTVIAKAFMKYCQHYFASYRSSKRVASIR